MLINGISFDFINQYSWWEGAIKLPIWEDYKANQEANASNNSKEILNTLFQIVIDTDTEKKQIEITSEQIEACKFTIENQNEIAKNMLQALFNDYPFWQSLYPYDDREKELFMPDIKTITDFEKLKLIELENIYVSYIQKDDIAYVGYVFGCNWDDEHGLGIMTHKNRVVEIGGADSASLWWVANNDAKGIKNEYQKRVNL